MERFLKAHEEYFQDALNEIKKGKKETHWMWFIFPQLKGLGKSSTAEYYGLASAEETMAFYNNEELRNNLITITTELLKLETNDPEAIFGCPDNLKLKSSMTLFYSVTKNSLFKAVLDKFFSGDLDSNTINLLK